MNVQQLWFYPIKSCAGIQTESLFFDQYGPKFDREWMLVDELGIFVSQRELPKLALVKTAIKNNFLHVEIEADFFEIDLNQLSEAYEEVELWGQKYQAISQVTKLNEKLSQFLNYKVHLVRHGDKTKRLKPAISPSFQPETKFSDRMPIQMFSTASLDDLNQRIANNKGNPVPADRFRANLIFTADVAFLEDHWRKIKIGEVTFSQPKKCTRCVITTIDQKTGQKTGAEPLKTLATYRRENNQVAFGQFFIPENSGTISVGDEIIVLE